MVNYNGGIANLQKHTRKKMLKKVERLIAGKPKHSDEKRMNFKQIDNVIDTFLLFTEAPDKDQAKIATQIYIAERRLAAQVKEDKEVDDSVQIEKLLQKARQINSK